MRPTRICVCDGMSWQIMREMKDPKEFTKATTVTNGIMVVVYVPLLNLSHVEAWRRGGVEGVTSIASARQNIYPRAIPGCTRTRMKVPVDHGPVLLLYWRQTSAIPPRCR